MTRKQARLTIGDCAKMDANTARAEARKLLRRIEDKEDPRSAPAARELTFRAAYGIYENLVLPGLATEWRSKVSGAFAKRILPKVGAWPVSGVGRADIRSIYEPFIHDHPATALQLRKIISAFLSWCVDRDFITVNPIRGTKLPSRPSTRDRVLKDEELLSVWRASDALGDPLRSVVKLLMLTGQRKSEVLGMHADEINASTRVWEIPAVRTKNRRAQRVPLSDLAWSLIEPRLQPGRHLFTTSFGEKPMKFRQDLVVKLRDRANIRDFRLHDLRRSAASTMAELTVQPHVIEAVLNHQNGIISGVAAVYNRYQYATEKHDALNRLAAKIKSLIEAAEREEASVIL